MRARLSAKSGAISTKLTPQSDTEALIRMGPSPLAGTLITDHPQDVSPLSDSAQRRGDLFFSTIRYRAKNSRFQGRGGPVEPSRDPSRSSSSRRFSSAAFSISALIVHERDIIMNFCPG